LNPSKDLELNAIEIETLRAAERIFASSQAQRMRVDLAEAIAAARFILRSPMLQGIMNLPDKHLAHSLTQTCLEKRVGVVASIKRGGSWTRSNAKNIITRSER
jgi:hypothetical protein